MVPEQDGQFLLGIFLMEAWDALATLEDGLARLEAGADATPALVAPLVVVTHRLKGAAGLHGFPELSDLAGVGEEVLERVPRAETEECRQARLLLADLVGVLKHTLDTIGASGREDAEGIIAFRARHPVLFAASPGAEPPPPEAPLSASAEPARTEDAAGGLVRELERFFSQNGDVLAFFEPEATEHLETMTRALLALEQIGPSDEDFGTLFRAVHTLKGAAYTVGFLPMGDLGHRIEDLLVAVREHRVALTPAVIEGVLAGVDALRLLLGSANGVPPDLPEILQRATEGFASQMLAPESPAESPSAAEAPLLPLVAPAEPVAQEPVLVESLGPEAAVSAPALPEPVRPESGLPDPGAQHTVTAVPAEAGAPPGPAARPASPAPPPPTRPGLRVNLERLDALMNLIGELVIARSRLDRRLVELDRAGELLLVVRTRMARAARDLEGRPGALPTIPPAPDGFWAAEAGLGMAPRMPLGELFAELEFDRYDDIDVLGRRVAEMAADLGEVQSQLAGLIRAVWEDTGQIQRLTGDLRTEITRARMVPVGKLFARFSRQVRQAAKVAGKAVVLDVTGESVEVDNTIVEQIADPLLHLVQNAITHGIEPEEERRARGKPVPGTVTLHAYHQGGSIYVEVEDDGRGVDAELVKAQAVRQGFVRPEAADRLESRQLLNLIFLPGFSMAPTVTAASGRGVGLDVVRANIGRLNGEIGVETEAGVGTRFTLKLPLTVVVSDALMVRVGSEPLALPLNAVRSILAVHPLEIESVGRAEMIRVDDQLVELIRLDRMLGLGRTAPPGPLSAVVLRAAGRTIAVATQEVLGKEEIVIKSLGSFLDGIGPFAGATISGEGRVILLVDPVRLVEAQRSRPFVRGEAEEAPPEGVVPEARPGLDPARRVLLVDDSVSVRRFVGQMLEKAGLHVLTATDGAEALDRLAVTPVRVVITDLEMPRINGYELIQDLRRRPATREIPIVVLTTRAGDKHVALAQRLGATHYVTKPVDERAFVGLVKDLAATPVGAVEPIGIGR